MTWLEFPPVTAILVTTDASLHSYACSAIDCFMGQTWPHREMLVINGTNRSFAGLGGIRELCFKARFLHEYKNIGLYNATGEWCLPWCDDCHYEPSYIEYHMLHRSREAPTLIANPTGRIMAKRTDVALMPESATFCAYFRINPNVYDGNGSELHYLNCFSKLNRLYTELQLAVRFFENDEQ